MDEELKIRLDNFIDMKKSLELLKTNNSVNCPNKKYLLDSGELIYSNIKYSIILLLEVMKDGEINNLTNHVYSVLIKRLEQYNNDTSIINLLDFPDQMFPTITEIKKIYLLFLEAKEFILYHSEIPPTNLEKKILEDIDTLWFYIEPEENENDVNFCNTIFYFSMYHNCITPNNTKWVKYLNEYTKFKINYKNKITRSLIPRL